MACGFALVRSSGLFLVCLHCGWINQAGDAADPGAPSTSTPGLLGEYFTPLPLSCSAANGSFHVLDGLVPTFVRGDSQIVFQDLPSFKMDRCAWRFDTAESLQYLCDNTDSLNIDFGVRWTGYLRVVNAGAYTFQLDLVGGGRLIMGNAVSSCPGPLCGTRHAVNNLNFHTLQRTSGLSPTYAQQCSACASGDYSVCFLTGEGCEPFILWELEADGAVSGSCGSQNKATGTRFLTKGLYPIKIEYFLRGGVQGRINWQWKGPDSNGVLVSVPPLALLMASGNYLKAEYFTFPASVPSSLPPLTDPAVLPTGASFLVTYDDDWSDWTTFTSLLVARGTAPTLIWWSGFLTIQAAGTYTFRTQCDGGCRFVIGGRGAQHQAVLAVNDGPKVGRSSATGTVDLLPGLWPMRLEYIWVPPQGIVIGNNRGPSMQLYYTGPDTAAVEVLVTSGVFGSCDVQCTLMNFGAYYSVGMFQIKDCNGRCFQTSPGIVGDGICDNPSSQFYLTCPVVYNNDNGDCLAKNIPIPIVIATTAVPCRVSCPSGNFKRKDCSQCHTQDAGTCVESMPSYCNGLDAASQMACWYKMCCVAKLSNVDYWGQDCIAYGTNTTCEDGLQAILSIDRAVTPSLDTIAAHPEGFLYHPSPQGSLMANCTGTICNSITTDFNINPFTLLPTDQRVCPVQESTDPGIPCFEGPWEETKIQYPLTQCQNGQFQNNFCINQKSIDGRPFKRCCSFLFITAQGTAGCSFVGLAESDCQTYLDRYQQERALSVTTAITSPILLISCTRGRCNDPTNPDTGCPSVVNTHPPQTADILPTGPPTADMLSKGAAVNPTDNSASTIGMGVGIAIGFCLLAAAVVALVCFIRYRTEDTDALKVFASEKVLRVSDDTFVEPSKDGLGGQLVVKPRSFAFRELYKKQVLPKAMRQDDVTGILALHSSSPKACQDDIAPEAPSKRPPMLEEAALNTLAHEGSRKRARVDIMGIRTPSIASSGAPRLPLQDLPGQVPEHLIIQNEELHLPMSPGESPLASSRSVLGGRPAALARQLRRGKRPGAIQSVT